MFEAANLGVLSFTSDTTTPNSRVFDVLGTKTANVNVQGKLLAVLRGQKVSRSKREIVVRIIRDPRLDALPSYASISTLNQVDNSTPSEEGINITESEDADRTGNTSLTSNQLPISASSLVNGIWSDK